jgi:hypothetical protein
MISIEIDLYIARNFKSKIIYIHEIKACENKIMKLKYVKTKS